MLLFPPKYVLEFVATNNRINIQQQSDNSIGKTKEPDKLTSSQLAPIESSERLKGFLYEKLALYGIEDQYDKAVAVVHCESSWKIDPRPHNGISLGIAQFTKPTWDDYGVGRYEDINPYDQLSVMAKMWSKGLQKRWDCYKILGFDK